MSPAVLPIALDQGTVWRRSVSLRAGTAASILKDAANRILEVVRRHHAAIP